MSKALGLIALVVLTSAAHADTVVDVSQEWNAHASSAAVPHVTPPTPRENMLSTPTPVTETCACDIRKPQEYLEDATYSFTGFVDEATPVKKGKRMVTFDVGEIFKGTPGTEMKTQVEVKNDGCDLPFEKNQNYLVFAKWEWGTLSTHRCMGTKLLNTDNRAALGPSEQLKEKLYIRLRNACMGRRDTACCLQSLKAMKAGYFLPEPEAGCPDGSLPDRLKCAGSYTWCIPTTEKRTQAHE